MLGDAAVVAEPGFDLETLARLQTRGRHRDTALAGVERQPRARELAAGGFEMDLAGTGERLVAMISQSDASLHGTVGGDGVGRRDLESRAIDQRLTGPDSFFCRLIAGDAEIGVGIGDDAAVEEVAVGRRHEDVDRVIPPIAQRLLVRVVFGRRGQGIEIEGRKGSILIEVDPHDPEREIVPVASCPQFLKFDVQRR